MPSPTGFGAGTRLADRARDARSLRATLAGCDGVLWLRRFRRRRSVNSLSLSSDAESSDSRRIPGAASRDSRCGP